MADHTRPIRGPIANIIASAVLSISLLGLSGCGGGDDLSPVSKSVSAARSAAVEPQGSENGPSVASSGPIVPVAAVSPSNDPTADEFPLASPEKGTPEWLLREIARLRTQLPSDGPQSADQRQAHHEKIIELARQAIAATHRDVQREQLFNNAVHYLSDARLALAMSGDTEQSQLLVEDADSLYRRDSKSFSAIESAYKVVQLAQRKAEQHGRANPEWLTEFANQARLFAEKFPHEPNRSALVLLTAGRLCDQEGMTEAARNCFALVQSEFSETIFSEQVDGFLRRMSLVGQPLVLAGPTLEGGYVAVEDYRGDDTLVVFWAAASPEFHNDANSLQEIHAQFSDQRVRIIGVNLDVDEGRIDQFLSEHPHTWPHIFYSEPEKRGSHHPLAEYYGVQQTPTYFLVDHSGIVTAVSSDLGEIQERLQQQVGSR